MYLVHIRHQDHSIHVFDGIIEITRVSDNVIVITRVEYDKLLKLTLVPHLSHRYPQIWLNIVVICLPTYYDMPYLVTLIMIVSYL